MLRCLRFDGRFVQWLVSTAVVHPGAASLLAASRQKTITHVVFRREDGGSNPLPANNLAKHRPDFSKFNRRTKWASPHCR